MKEIDDSIKAALRDAALESGSVLSLSRKLGVSHSTVLFWGSGRTRKIDGDVWRYKVYPVLEPYLKRLGAEPKLAGESSACYSKKTRGEPSTRLREVPVISLSQAAGFDPALEPFDSYARSCGKETAFFAIKQQEGCFALKIEGRGMEPLFPDGALLLVAGGEFVENGDIVVARIRQSGEVVIKRLVRNSRSVILDPLAEGGSSFQWNRDSGRGFLEWMHPVVEAKVDFRARRENNLRAEAGISF